MNGKAFHTRPRRAPARSARLLATLVIAAAGFIHATPLAAQQDSETSARALTALETCIAAAEAEDERTAKPAADEATRLFRELALEPGRPADGLAGQARVLSQCRIPFASFMRKGDLLAESNGLLERALRIEPTHFAARFTLGMNHYHSPGFMRRADDAIAAFETLIEQHGDAGTPRLMEAYLLLGDLYLRQDRKDDALAIWAAGAARFPDEPSFEERRRRVRGSAAEPADSTSVASASVQGEGAPSPPSTAGDDPDLFDLDPLVVQAGAYSMDDPRASTTVTRMEVYTTPGGTADIMQTFQLMPGVTRATEASDLYVRGGEPAEAPVWVDGLRLPYASTFESLHGGLFGVLDPTVLKSAYFSSGGFSARYGDALSGVLDLTTEGRPRHASWRLGANVVGAGGAARVPLGERAGAWAAASGTETSGLLAMQGRSDEYPSSPRAAQAIASLIVEPTDALELRATALREADRSGSLEHALGYHGVFVADGDTWMTALSGRLRDAGSGSSLGATLGVAARTTGYGFGVLDWSREDRSARVRVDGDHLLSGRARVRAGVEAARLTADEHGVVPTTEVIRPGSPSARLAREDDTHHLGGYVEAELRATNDLGVVFGARADRLPGESAVTVDPRAAAVYRLGDRWSARVGTGIFHQGRWRTRLALPDGGRPAGVPRRAAHLAGSIQRDGELRLRAEAYLKRYDRYATSDAPGATNAGGTGRTNAPPQELPAGPSIVSGTARGLDLLASWDDGGALHGWLAWSLLDGGIELEDGRDASSTADVTHTLTLVSKWAFADRWQLGGTARYATGRPFTPVVGRTLDEEGRAVPAYGDPNGERLPRYVRLDARVTRVVPLGVGFAAFYLEALNVLDRGNVMAYTYDEGYEQRRPIESFFAQRTLVLGIEAQF